MSHTLFVLLDGLEDDPHPDLGGKKPFEVADMPYLRRKTPFRLKTNGRGYTHLFLNEFFTGHPPEMGRAAIEAMGMGLRDISDPKRTAYRLSPVKVEDGMIRWCYHASVFKEKLIASVNSHLDLLEGRDPKIAYFIGGRAILTMESDYVPITPAPPVDAPYVELEGEIGELVRAVMKDMDGITDYPWGCGKFGRQYEPVEGMTDLVAVSDNPTALGICASLGYEAVLEEDMRARVEYAREALKHRDVFLHFEEVDESGHQKDPFKKKEVLEDIDRLMAEYFEDAENIIFFVDHGTSCVTGEHILTDVPLWTDIDTGLEMDTPVPLNEIVSILLRNKR